MSLTRLTTDVANISKLDDYPPDDSRMTTSKLRGLFDQGSVDIKNFINSTLITEIDTSLSDKLSASELSSAVSTAVNDAVTNAFSYTVYYDMSLITVGAGIDTGSGDAVTYSDGAVAQNIDCKNALSITISGRGMGGLTFYDSGKNKIKPVGSSQYATLTNNGTFNIPPNAVTCAVSMYRYDSSNVSITIEKITDFDSITGLSKNLSQILRVADNIDAISQNTQFNGVLYRFGGIFDDSGDITSVGWSQGTSGVSQNSAGISSPLIVNKYYSISNKQAAYDFIPGANSNIAFFTIPSVNIGEWSGAGSMVSIDFSTGTLETHYLYDSSNPTSIPSVMQTKSFTVPANYATSAYRFVWKRVDKGMSMSLVSLTDNSVIVSDSVNYVNGDDTPSWGHMHDYFACAALSGGVNIKAIEISISNARNTFLYIAGDSITDAASVLQSNGYAFLLKSAISNTVVSGRHGGNIFGLLERMDSEMSLLNPKYVMVTIGTNGGNTSALLNSLISKITAVGATPIINCVPCEEGSNMSGVNSMILALGVKSCRMDIATALNYDIANNGDSSIFVNNLHPNEAGHLRMETRAKIDVPELFN